MAHKVARRAEENLVRAITEGDAAAIEEAMPAYESMLRRSFIGWIAVYTGRAGAASASATVDDLVQETFLRLVTTAGKYDPERGSASQFIHGIARSVWKSYLQKQSRARSVTGPSRVARSIRLMPKILSYAFTQPLVEGSVDLDVEEVVPAWTVAVEEETAARENLLKSALEKLRAEKPDLHEVLLQRFYHGRSHAEIAVAKGISEGTSRSRLARALSFLRAELETGEEIENQ